MWIVKSLVSSEAREKSLDKTSDEANSALCRVQPCLSCEAEAKEPLCADSVADAASLPLPAQSAKKVLSHKARIKAISVNDLSREIKDKAPMSANNEAILASLKDRTLLRELSSLSKAELK